MDILELDSRLNALIIQRKSREAFLEYYDENVVAQENDDAERVGREPWMQLRLGFETKIKQFTARVLANAANGDTSFSEWEIDAEIEGMGAIHTIQVAVRRWKNGRIVRERFYHK
jgi:hypothetical protein